MTKYRLEEAKAMGAINKAAQEESRFQFVRVKMPFYLDPNEAQKLAQALVDLPILDLEELATEIEAVERAKQGVTTHLNDASLRKIVKDYWNKKV